jgi:hypothetical protein
MAEAVIPSSLRISLESMRAVTLACSMTVQMYGGVNWLREDL